ncbi:Defensin-like protein 7 [Sesamum angolense]|uniref:Defensin-like protein 7 n=1 Tax=Sesamum angolense TaxID=2727404 RepID=A0AAE1WSL4_9LAMI|nr:Defensin-like protein 7 [Sesamum angolense]
MRLTLTSSNKHQKLTTMGLGIKSARLILQFLLLIFASQECKGRTCRSASENFKGFCFVDQNCRIVCSQEGFTDGRCEGIWRRCVCEKPCESSSSPPSSLYLYYDD